MELTSKEKTSWKKQFYQNCSRYYQALNTISDDFNFFCELWKKDQEKAIWFFEFFKEAHGSSPATSWGKQRRNGWTKDLYAANNYDLLRPFRDGDFTETYCFENSVNKEHV